MSEQHENAFEQTKEQVEITHTIEKTMKRQFQRYDKAMKRQFQCDLCSYSFERKVHLESHRNIHWDDTELYECNICNYKATLSKLNKHQKVHAKENKRFPCYYCSSDFINESALKQHENAHTGEKPYKCGECSFTFPNETSLRWHMMTIHTKTNESPSAFLKPDYVQKRGNCPICDKEMCAKMIPRHLRNVHGRGVKP